MSPSDAVKKGIFRGSGARSAAILWRTRTAWPTRNDRLPTSSLWDRPKGEARQVQDTAYSPDGTLLATAHWYNADPGEVKLWDTKNGKLVGSLPVTTKEGGVIALTFSPDGKILAGSVGVLPNARPPGVVVLWDIAGRRELRPSAVTPPESRRWPSRPTAGR